MKNLIFLILFTSCAVPKFYRATVGISTNNSSFKTKTEDSSGNEKTRNLCVESINTDVTDAQKCSGGGFKEDKGLGYWDPWIEFVPSYFGKSNFGFSYFLAYNSSKTVLLDYPVVSEKTSIEIERFSFNPIVYYNIGDKFLKKSGGISFRIGIGGALNYVSHFKIKRESTGETNEPDTKVKPGLSAFIEFNWSWFTFRVENSQIEYHGKKFNGLEKDTLIVENNKASAYYSHYF